MRLASRAAAPVAVDDMVDMHDGTIKYMAFYDHNVLYVLKLLKR